MSENVRNIHFCCVDPNCPGKITKGVMQRAYYEKKSKWVATGNPDAELLGFHLNQFYSPWRKWPDIVSEIKEAKGIPSKEKVVQNTVWGLTYELSSVKVPDWQKLHQLKSDFRPGFVPAEACVLTAFTDVQEDRFETSIVGWNRHRAWLVDHIITPGGTVWDLDDEMYALYEDTVLNGSWTHASGRKLKPRHFFIDSGFFTSRVLKFCQKHKGKLHPTKGDDRLESTFSAPKKTSISFRGRLMKSGVKRWNLGVSQIKIDMYARLNQLIDGGDQDKSLAIFFNKSLPEEYFKQLTAEVCYVEPNDYGRPKSRWVKEKYFANEALDCLVGNMAAFEIEGYNRWPEERWEAEAKKLKSLSSPKKENKGQSFSMV